MLTNLFPVIWPDNTGKMILSKFDLKRIMSSVAWLNKEQKERKIHETFNFRYEIFLDCGIFQRRKYEKILTYEDVCNYREKLSTWYNHLKPNIASAFDIPFSFLSPKKMKYQKLVWSIDNYKFLQERLNKIRLVLGACIFDENDLFLFKKLLEKRKVSPELIGLCGQVPLMRDADKNPRLGKIVVKNVYLMTKTFRNIPLHVYGAGDHRWYALVRLMGASSSDYAGYLYIASRGAIVLPGTGPMFILKKVKIVKGQKVIYYARPSDRILTFDEYILLENCNCPFCKDNDPLLLEEKKENRILHNLYITLSETKTVDSFYAENNHQGLIRYIKSRLFNTRSGISEIARYAVKLFLNS